MGTMTPKEMFGYNNFISNECQVFDDWYKTHLYRTDWSFKDEMKLYCQADVVLLAKTAKINYFMIFLM